MWPVERSASANAAAGPEENAHPNKTGTTMMTRPMTMHQAAAMADVVATERGSTSPSWLLRVKRESNGSLVTL